MIKAPSEKRSAIAGELMPDLTPLLDVMFMLIIFFILTANAVPFAMDVTLPEDNESITKAVEDTNVISVTILENDQGWKINDTPYTSEADFKTALKKKALDDAENNARKVIIIGDKNASMQKLMTVLAFLRKNNIEAADIIMDRP